MTQKSPSVRLAAPPSDALPEVVGLLDPVALEARLVKARARRAEALARRHDTDHPRQEPSPAAPVVYAATTVPPIVRPAAPLTAPPRAVADPRGHVAPAKAPARRRVPMATMFLAGLGLGLGAVLVVQASPSFRERLAGWISPDDAVPALPPVSGAAPDDAAPAPPPAGVAVEDDTGPAEAATPTDWRARTVGLVEETPAPSTEAPSPAAERAPRNDAALAPPPAAEIAAPDDAASAPPPVAKVAGPISAPAPPALATAPEQPLAPHAARAAAPAPDAAVRIAALAAPSETAPAPPPLAEVALPTDAPTPLAAAPSPAQSQAPGAAAMVVVAPAPDAAVRIVALAASPALPAVDPPYDLEPPATPPAASPSEVLPAARPGTAPQDVPALAAGTRLFVHHPPGARAAAEAAASWLRQAGLGEVTIIAVPHVVSRTNVRFFHETDAGAARDVAALLAAAGGAAPEIRDFTDYSPPPRPGMVEVWLPGDVPAAARRRSQTPPAPVAAAPASRATPLAGGVDIRRLVEEVVRDRATMPAPAVKVEAQSLKNSTWFDREIGRVFRRLGGQPGPD